MRSARSAATTAVAVVVAGTPVAASTAAAMRASAPGPSSMLLPVQWKTIRLTLASASSPAASWMRSRIAEGGAW